MTVSDYIPTPDEIRAAPPPDVAQAIQQVLAAFRGGETYYVVRCDDWPLHVRVQVDRRFSARGWDVRFDDGIHGSQVIISELRARAEPAEAQLAQVTAERDALRALLAAAAIGRLLRCETCGDRLATRLWAPGDTFGVCDQCFREEQRSEADVGSVLDAAACVDLPHAAALRDAIGGAK